MKILHLIPILFLAAFCTVSAQTNTAPASTSTPALLTTNQAEALAIQLANDKYKEAYEANVTDKIDVFGTNTPDVVVNGVKTVTLGKWGTHINTRFIDGHWISALRKDRDTGLTSPWCIATVEFAPNGSTNSVEVHVYLRPGRQP